MPNLNFAETLFVYLEEELLCKVKSSREGVVPGGYVFYISINSLYLFF
jgi:hypothetical protein